MPTALKKEIAGIPVYVWLLLVVAAVGIGIYLRRRAAAKAQDTYATDYGAAEMQAVPGTVGGGPGGGGIVSGNGSAPSGITSEELTAALQTQSEQEQSMFQQLTSAFASGLSSLGSTITGAIANIPQPSQENTNPFPAPSSPPSQPSGTAPPPVPAPAAAGSSTTVAPPATVVTQPSAPAGPVAGASFTWVFASIPYHGTTLPAHSIWYAGDKSLFLQHLGARGLSYATWAANHRSAACRVFGDCA